MRFKTTWILIAAFAALAAYLFLVDDPRQEARQAEEAAHGLLFPTFDADQVSEIRIEGKAGKVLLRKGERGVWRLLQPWDDRADDGRVQTLLSDLKVVKADRDVAAAGADLAPFGLTEPEAVVAVVGQEVALAIGGQNPARDARYVRVGDGPVRVAKNSALGSFLRQPGDLRSRGIIEGFPWERLAAIEIHSPGTAAVRLVQEGETWRLAEPFTAEADPEAAEQVADKLRWARIATFLDPKPEDAESKLAAGTEVRFQSDDDGEAVVVRLTRVDGAIWADCSGRDAVFTLNDEIWEAYQRSADDLRRRQPALVKAWKVKGLSVEGDGEVLPYAKNEGTWERAGTALPAEEQAALDALIEQLDSYKAEAVIDPPDAPTTYGLDQPRYVVTVTDTDGGEQRFSVGTVAGESYAVTSGSLPIYRMGGDYLDAFEALLQAVRSPSSEAEPQVETGKAQ